jgi:hypothetical protein
LQTLKARILLKIVILSGAKDLLFLGRLKPFDIIRLSPRLHALFAPWIATHIAPVLKGHGFSHAVQQARKKTGL